MSKAFWRGFLEGLNPIFWLCMLLNWFGRFVLHVVLTPIQVQWWHDFWYPVYEKPMVWSWLMQDRFGFSGPWHLVEDSAAGPLPGR